MRRVVEFYSESVKLRGDLYVPDGLKPGEQRPAVLLCHGYTGVKDLYLPDNARYLNQAGYIALALDYKGWGASEGEPRSRLNPYGRVMDVLAALTFLGLQDHVDPDRMGLYGTSYGGATVVWAAAIDQRVRATVSAVGVGHGARWMSRVRRPDEYADLLELGQKDREQRVLCGQSELRQRGEILMPDRHAAAFDAKRRAGNPNAVSTISADYVDDTLYFNAEWVVDKISPRPVLFITSDKDYVVLPEESEELYRRAGEPKKLVTLKGFAHYDVYVEPALGQVMAETIAWYDSYLKG